MPTITPSTYSLSQVRPPWLHALFGYAGPRAGKQQRFLTPPEQPEFAHHHLRMLDSVLGRTECAGRFALTFADLSRRTPGASAGRGCLAIVLTSRVEHGTDSVGRGSPTFKHALIAAERSLDRYTLQAAALGLIHSAVGIEATSRGRAHEQYLRYIEAMSGGSTPEQAAADFLIPYLQGCAAWSAPARAQGAKHFILPKPEAGLIHITHRRSQDLVDLIVPAAQLAAILYNASSEDTGEGQSIPWVAVEIGTTRYVPEKDGLTVRFIPEDEQTDSGGSAVTLKLDDLPKLEDDETYAAELARVVFQRVQEEGAEVQRVPTWIRDRASAGEHSKGTRVTTERSGPHEPRTQVNSTEGPQRVSRRTNGSVEAATPGGDLDRQTRPMPVFIPPPLVPQPPPRRSLRPLLWGGVVSWGLVLLGAALKILFLNPSGTGSTVTAALPCPEMRCELRGVTTVPSLDHAPAGTGPGGPSGPSGPSGKSDDKAEGRKNRNDIKDKDKDRTKEPVINKGAERATGPKPEIKPAPKDDAKSGVRPVGDPSRGPSGGPSEVQGPHRKDTTQSAFNSIEADVRGATPPLVH